MKTVVLIGPDEATFRYLVRRLKSLVIEHVPRMADFEVESRTVDLVILTLDADVPEPFIRLAQRFTEIDLPFIVLSSVETMKAAVQSIRLGAFDYFLTTEDRDELVDAVLRRLEPCRIDPSSATPEVLDGDDSMVGSSQQIQDVFKMIGKVAQSSVSVLLRGESGTGKELVARQIHANSQRRDAPFVVIDCASIPRELVENELFGHEAGAYSGAADRHLGKFDLADRGTLLLDEITELDIDLQSKILRVIQQGTFDRVGGTRSIHVDVRTIATTQTSLEQLVSEGRFREDLFHRLNVIALELPPMRSRRDDVPLLVRHFVRMHSSALGVAPRPVSAELMSRLQRYEWPGNVRELENIVKRALLLERGPIITPRFLEEFPVPGDGPVDEQEVAFQRTVSDRFLTEELNWKRPDVYKQMLTQIERVILKLILQHSHGNQVSASRLLGISRNTLRVKMVDHRLDSREFRS